MPSLSVEPLLAWSQHFAPLHPSAFYGPLLLAAVFFVHLFYYRRSLRSDGQQVVAIADLTDFRHAAIDHSVLWAEGMEFCALEGSASTCQLPTAPAPVPLMTGGPKMRFEESLEIGRRNLMQTIICAEDLIANDHAHFYKPVKVGGDLIVRGTAYFDQTVVVNGSLKVEGHAIFARGIVAKGETLVTGDITIGTREIKGWAVLRSLTLVSRLRLNGQLISDEHLALPEAA